MKLASTALTILSVAGAIVGLCAADYQAALTLSVFAAGSRHCRAMLD